MFATVDHFLCRERLDLLAQPLGNVVDVTANAFDEERLPLRKGRRQGIVQCCRERISAVPPALRPAAGAEAKVTRSDRQVRWRGRPGRGACNTHSFPPSSRSDWN